MDSCSFVSVYLLFCLEGDIAMYHFWEDCPAERKKGLHAHWPLHPLFGAHTAG
jgi:hypothetical protein